MIAWSVVMQALASFGGWCFVAVKGQADPPREVFMVVRSEGQGKPRQGSVINTMVARENQRDNASLGYGLIRAEDAPEGMTRKTKLCIVDSLGRNWESDAALEVADTDPETGNLVIAAWRLALWHKQSTVKR